MSAINVNSITGRTGTHGPVLTGVTTVSNALNVGSGVTINPDGSAIFAGGATNITGSGIVQVSRTSSTNDCFEAQLNGTANVIIKANGSASFKAPSSSGVEVQTVGGNEGTKFPFVGKNTSGTTTFSVDGDGTVMLAGSVVSGSLAAGGGGGAYLTLGEAAAYSATATSYVWRGWDTTGGSNALTSSIKADGTTMFVGPVKIGGSAAANEMNEYEEGNWTGTLFLGGNSITFTNGKYTKTGQLVTIMGRISGLVTPNGSAVQITSLPFTPTSGEEAVGSVMYDTVDLSGTSGVEQVNCYISTGNLLSFYMSRSNNAGWTQIVGTQMGTNGNIVFTISYVTDS